MSKHSEITTHNRRPMKGLHFLAHANKQLRQSLRYKLLLLIVIPLLLTALGFSIMAAYWTSSYTDKQLYMKVSADLSVAQGTLDILQREQMNVLAQLANGYDFRTNLLRNYQRGIRGQLNDVRQSRQLDFLRFIPASQLLNSLEPSLLAHTESLLKGDSLSGLEVLSANELDLIQTGLAKRSRIPLIDTPYAAPTQRSIESRAIIMRSLYPVINDFDELVGVLDGGTLFNRNTQVVDMIRDLVYGPGSLPDKGIGTVTLFLDDTRISTNVPQLLPDQRVVPHQTSTITEADRAIGTRVSSAVKNHVLIKGNRWIDRAFVVNDWYISAYQPLIDLSGQRIGMIYTGFSEAPFTHIYYKTLLESVTVIGLIMLGSGLLVLHKGKQILAPLSRLNKAVNSVKQGNMQQRIGHLEGQDELTELAHEFDKMLDLLAQREQEIIKANDELEQKVDQRTTSLRRRTEALKDRIRLLKTTRKQLLDQEKLAVLGELTAGIAHEINNPAAVILGSVDLILDDLGEQAKPINAELDMIIEQVYRIRSLINNLLQYSRPDSQTDSQQICNINQVCNDTLLLVRHALDKQNVTVETDYAAESLVEINTQQIQQVLVNLIINAAHAIKGTGSVFIGTEDWVEAPAATSTNRAAEPSPLGVVIHVSDLGCGIPDSVKERIFEPFFTTKESGTGLGLSVSKGIVTRHGGDLRVHSPSLIDETCGTTFSLYLPSHYSDQATNTDHISLLLTGLGQAERVNRRATGKGDT